MSEWQMYDWRPWIATLVLTTGLAVPFGSARAEDAAASDEAPTSSEPDAGARKRREGAIEEITVTARKRDENLQSTPISVLAFSADELESRQVTRITDIGEAVPNLKLDTSNGSNNSTRIYIRGVGQDDGRSNVDPGVGLYVDGVYIPRLTGSVVSTLDVEAIEVLRGPQGTLFGKNTVGGVVSLRTAKPGPEMGGRAQVRAGNFGLFESQGTLNLPLIEDLLLSRVTFETQTDEGYLRNRTKDSRTGDNKLLKGRVQLRFLPTETTSFDVSYEQTIENEKNPTPECRIGNPFAPGRFLTDNFAVGPNGERFTGSCSDARGDGSELTSGTDFEQKNDLETQFLIADLSWELGDSLTFKSLSSWRRVDTRLSNVDLDATAVDGFGVAADKDSNDALSQELQLTGKALGDRLTYTTGFYWFEERGHGSNRLSALSNVLAAIRNGTTDQLLFAGSEQVIPGGLSFAAVDNRLVPVDPNDPTGEMRPSKALTDAVLGLNGRGTSRFETSSLAGFLEGTLDITDQLSFTAGVRYTAERKERQGKTIPLPDASMFASRPDRGMNTLGLAVNDRFGKWTPRFTFEYQATDTVFMYAGYSRGFKSGGFNTTVLSPVPRQINGPLDDAGKFDEEVLDSYEIGLKTQWLDNRLVVNLAAFYNDYEDIQLTTIQIREDGRPQGNISNVAEATIRGFELDFQYRPFGTLTLSGGAGMTDVDYRDFFARIDTATELRNRGLVNFDTCTALTLDRCDLASFIAASGFVFSPGELPMGDFSDEDRTNTPNFNANLSVDYAFDLGTWGQLLARTTYFVQGDVEYSTFNDDAVRQSKYGLLNGRVAWEMPDGKTVIALFGRNLLNRQYLNGGFSLNDTNGVSTVFRGRPRSYGIEILHRF
jgi:iron complex outermembrane recepter protein